MNGYMNWLTSGTNPGNPIPQNPDLDLSGLQGDLEAYTQSMTSGNFNKAQTLYDKIMKGVNSTLQSSYSSLTSLSSNLLGTLGSNPTINPSSASLSPEVALENFLGLNDLLAVSSMGLGIPSFTSANFGLGTSSMQSPYSTAPSFLGATSTPFSTNSWLSSLFAGRLGI